jgi:hypothetical protein
MPPAWTNAVEGLKLDYIRTGRHSPTEPLQILAHQEMLVDWFDFWFNSHAAPAPEKLEQYALWCTLRDEHQAGAHPAD